MKRRCFLEEWVLPRCIHGSTLHSTWSDRAAKQTLGLGERTRPGMLLEGELPVLRHVLRECVEAHRCRLLAEGYLGLGQKPLEQALK